MRTARGFIGTLILAGALALGMAGCAGKASPSGHRTLFAVPTTLPDGTATTAQVAEFEAWLVERAGGYTRLDNAQGAWKSPSGEVVTEQNHIYIVGIYSGDPAAFAKEVDAYIVEKFEQEEAWVERW